MLQLPIVSSNNLSDALLIIDDAYPSNPNPSSAPRNPLAGSPQNLCQAGADGCSMIATGNPNGNPGGDYDGTSGHYNVFEGFSAGGNTVKFTVPLDPPGPSGSLTIRITNIRVDATQLVSPFALIPIQTYIEVIGGLGPVLSDVQPTVAYATEGLNFTQTQPVPIAGTSYTTFSAIFTEGFPGALKTWTDYQSAGPQNVPGFAYNTESGLWDKLAAPAGIPEFGLANHGTRLMFHFSGYPAGVTIIAPSAAYLGGDTASGIQATGAVMYVATDANGNSTAGPKASSSKEVQIITDSQGNGWLTYEVVGCNPLVTETVKIPVVVESQSTGTVTGSFGPLVSSGTAPIPRFVVE